MAPLRLLSLVGCYGSRKLCIAILLAWGEWIAWRWQACDPMKLDPKQDGQEQLVVELNSGRSYFVPREAVEHLFRFCPAGASALVARVTPVVDYHLDGGI